MIIILAYIATFTSAFCYSAGSIFQQIGSRRVKPMTSLNPHAFIGLFEQKAYIIGLAFDTVAFTLFVIVTHFMPLFFVQTVESSSIAVTAILARYFLKIRLHRRDYILIGIIFVGLMLVSFSASPEAAKQASSALKTVVYTMPVVVVLIALLLTKRLTKQPILAALLSGISFSGAAIASRMIGGQVDAGMLLLNPLVYATLIYAGMGMLLFSIALQNGLVTHVDATTFVVEILVPASVGLFFLGDHPRPGTAPFMITGLAIVVSSITALALTHSKSNIPKIA
jgi:drug/metabolite transporter (DMT)-like permease